jgi:hypothetical protein
MFLGTQDQVTRLPQEDIGCVILDTEVLLHIAQELDAERRHRDIGAGGELLPDAAGGQGRRGDRVSGITLDDRYPAVEAGIGGQEIGDRAADDATADDYHVVGNGTAGVGHQVAS